MEGHFEQQKEKLVFQQKADGCMKGERND